MLKIFWNKLDWGVLLPVVLLVLIGVMMMFSTSSMVGLSHYGDPYFFIRRHLVFLVLGIGACGVAICIPYRYYWRWLTPMMCGSFLLMILPLTPLGIRAGGASRWLDLGIISFQPIECVKFVLIVFMAVALSRPAQILQSFIKGIGVMVLMVGCCLILLLAQPDLGNTGLIMMVFFVLLSCSAVPLRHSVGVALISCVLVAGSLAIYEYQRERVLSFLNPWQDPLGANYHTIQSFTAIGSGGLWGVGLGESKLKYFYLPLQYSDFVYAIICEEGGFVGAVSVFFLYVLLLCIVYFKLCRADQFGFYLALGCVLLLCVQAFINIAVVVGLFPVTGIPLTFISFGGTSFIMSMFYVGVIINVVGWQKCIKGVENHGDTIPL